MSKARKSREEIKELREWADRCGLYHIHFIDKNQSNKKGGSYELR